MEVFRVNLKKAVGIGVLVVLIGVSGFIPMVQSDQYTVISVNPSSVQTGANQVFTVAINCVPAESIKSFECRISFDPDLVSVVEVREGDIFNGYETFFSNGTIDNENGEVTMIYGLILGVGNISSTGALVYVDFQTKEIFGQTSIVLSDVGVTNEEEYLPVTSMDGSAEILAMLPSIDAVDIVFSDPLDTNPLYGWYEVSCLVDDDDVDGTFLEVIRPDGSIINVSMDSLTATSFSSRVSTLGHGTYRYHVFVIDAQGNTVSSPVYSFIIPPNWDVNMDGYASVLDFTHISNKLGLRGADGWVREDVNNNGLVSISDMVGVSNYYHQSW